MGQNFILPDLGEGLTEAEIVSWLVAVGDTITIDQPVVEVESAKSIVELPSPFGGVVEALNGVAGQIIHAGQVLLTVTDAAEADAARPTARTAVKPAAMAAGVPVAEVDGSASGAVLIGYGTRENTGPVRRPATARFGVRPGSAAPVVAAIVEPVSEVTPATPVTAPASPSYPAGRSPVVSPLVRRLARENGLDATLLIGSGSNALVLRRDVESAIRERAAAVESTPVVEPAALAQPAPVAEPIGTRAAPTDDIRIPITGLRRVVSERMTTSRREIPEATVWLDVDATELFAARDRLFDATGERFSVTALIARFTVAGLRRFPLLNSSVDTASQEILQRGAINLGLAAQTPRGLMVPVVHDAHSLTTRELRDAIAGIVTQATDGSFPPSRLSGGTFTLNNFGALGVDGSAAIINHPEAAILGIGRMIERPWVVDHTLAVRTVVELSLVFDHRVCDGGTAAGFLTYIARCIENPVSMLADL
ncbi:2-oxo acid dehydrogenase subunit E2 [Cryobacterium sp. Hz7]|uniref:Dihydrolipoamide acetyltransferase component of pyruvate dehydrogenase complex n=1 Tax=Cryobacterium sandaracinum TaxID=1259247 RepID=A0ABY2JMH3_9MICO|nr:MULTISPECIES: dihydrolipoamide acetyltransferase family protein [Cryobacterium]TFB57863.1 2-oxo acid dehydrogenase subunit E2 [Cryobacterium sp. Hz7]TFD07190.1 2-oxo acid dehydrogenase subunit E2 [Cryobacterium sandaracinum]